MAKTSTNHVNPENSNESLTEDLDTSDDLEPKDQRLYSVIFPHLNLIQFHPKKETVLKIITYSKTKNSSSK